MQVSGLTGRWAAMVSIRLHAPTRRLYAAEDPGSIPGRSTSHKERRHTVPAEFENGFFVRKPAWHGLGTVLPDYVEREEAFRLSGQDWTVEKWEVLARKDANSPRIDVPGSFAAVRGDTHAVLCLHKDSYEVLQNTEGWDLAEAVADQDARVLFETGITL